MRNAMIINGNCYNKMSDWTQKSPLIERIEKMEQQQAALERRLQTARSKVKEEERKRETRRKILIGAMVLAKAEQSPEKWNDLVRELDRYLSTERDRQLFGLESGKE
jgi:uncharacterized membrane protein YccC